MELLTRGYEQKGEEQLLSGSFAELPMKYFFANITDVDIMLIQTDVIALERHRFQSYKGPEERLLITNVETDIGYVKLVSPTKWVFERKLSSRFDLDFPRGPSLKRMYIHSIRRMLSLNTNIPKFRALNFSTDTVMSINCLEWPSVAQEWVTRKRQFGSCRWPSEDLIQRIVERGCHFVPHPELKRLWRYSFSHAEVELLHSWTPTQKYVYHILRLIIRDMKVLLLKEMERNCLNMAAQCTETEDCITCKKIFCSYS